MKRVFKWVGIVGGVIVLALAAAIIVLSWQGRRTLRRTYQVSGLTSAIPASDSSTVVEGERQARVNGCFICHGQDLGGTVLIDAPPFFVTAANLTSGAGGIGSTYTNEDWDRSIRRGVLPSDRAMLPIMPTGFYHRLGDESFHDLVSYLTQLPPVDNELPPSRMRLLGQVLVGLGVMDAADGVSLDQHRDPTPERGPTPVFGDYLASITCAGCHGDQFEGGPALEPGTPAIPAIRTVGLWPFDAFDNAVRRGQAPDGRQYDPVMPYEHFIHMTDEEIQAIHRYFGTLSPTVASP